MSETVLPTVNTHWSGLPTLSKLEGKEGSQDCINNWQEKQGSKPAMAKSHELHSSPTHSNGHIHWASPIRRLPPEPQTPNNNTVYNHHCSTSPLPQDTATTLAKKGTTASKQFTTTTTTTRLLATSPTTNQNDKLCKDNNIFLQYYDTHMYLQNKHKQALSK